MPDARYLDWFGSEVRDATYGYDLEALHAVPPVPPPDGFAERWRSWYAEAMTVAPEPVLTPVGRQGAHEVFVVEHAVANGLRLRGWLALPIGGPARVGIVHGHGYGGRDAPDFSRVPDDAAVIFPIARGQGVFNAGLGAPTPDDGHVLFGIESVDTYSLGRCAVDLWHAASALVEVAGELPLYYIGESFGGGIGALALPWDERFVGATLVVPSFGQYDIRLQLQCEGSGERVRGYVAEHPEAREVLRCFDASTAAGFLELPVRVECALWDGFVPPPGQFAVANAIDELELQVLPAGHAEYPGVEAVLAESYAGTRAHLARALEAARSEHAAR
ncbi:acetylxylan esterase [Plantibacter flavus]|uniref:acetylxylan esterase n=1 Tax=Plantibacter flavus TaxID=150123 RepID=UPI003F143ADC